MIRLFYHIAPHVLMVYVLATIDLNIKELQYVADHLTPAECRQVEAALKQRHYGLNVEKLDNDTKLLDEKTKNTPCLVRLLNWDRGVAKKNTFHDLAIRLRELGFKEVSDKLSKTVYHEKAEAVKKGFLNDPFKKLIPKKSQMLDRPEDWKQSKMEPAPPEDESHYNIVLWCVLGSLSFIGVLLVSCYVCCPKVFCMIWRKAAPEGCVLGCDIMIIQWTGCCSRFCKHTDKHLLGKRSHKKRLTGQSSPHAVPSREDLENALQIANNISKNL